MERKQMVNFDNRVSWMDIVAIVLAVGAILKSYYGVGANVDQNTARIDTNVKAIERVERDVRDTESKVLTELKETRSEAAERSRRIEDKLDRLIERELRGEAE